MILEGKVAIVAGAGPGIGAGVAHVLAEEGADLAALDINQGNADKVAEDAKKLGRRAIGIGTDLTSKAECEKAVKTTLDTNDRKSYNPITRFQENCQQGGAKSKFDP